MRKLAVILCSLLAAVVAAEAQLPSHAPAPSDRTVAAGSVAPDNTTIAKLELTEDAPREISAANLTAIPEPATYMLIGLGLLICAQQFRRKKG